MNKYIVGILLVNSFILADKEIYFIRLDDILTYEVDKCQLPEWKKRLIEFNNEYDAHQRLTEEWKKISIETNRKEWNDFSQKWEQSNNRLCNNQLNAHRENLIIRIINIVKTIAQLKNAHSVINFNTRHVFYVDPRFDITDQVISEFNRAS